MFYAITSPQNNSVHFTLNRKQHSYNEWWWERCISDAQIIEAEAILVFEPRSCFITHDVSVLAKTEVWIGTDVHGLADRQTIPARSDVLAGNVFAEWKSRCVSRKPSSWVLNKSVLSLSLSVPPPTTPQLEVQSPPGNIVGYVQQEWHPFIPKFTIHNEHKEPVLKLQGPFCGWSCLPDVDFEVLCLCPELSSLTLQEMRYGIN